MSSSLLRLLGLLLRTTLPLVLIAVGYYAYTQLSIEEEEEKKDEATAEQVIRTTVTELDVQDYPVVIRTNGIVQAHNEVTLSAEVSGRVTRVSSSFEVGSYFSKGDVLVELDERDFKTAVAVAHAAHLSAESALQLAIKNHERNLKLNDNQVVSISEAEINQSAAVKAQAEASLDSAAANLEQAERDLGRTRIVAPFNGRVRQKMVGVGQSVGPGAPLGICFAIDYAEVRLPIGARERGYLDLPELPSDPPLEIKLRDAIREDSETVWQARIVRTEGTLDENSLALFAIAQIDDPFGRQTGYPPLRIGQPVVAIIPGQSLKDVVAVPRTAVRQLDQVIVIDKQELTLQSVTIDPLWSDEEHVLVRDPNFTDDVYVATTQLVYAPDGSKVEIIPSIDEEDETAVSKVDREEAMTNVQ